MLLTVHRNERAEHGLTSRSSIISSLQDWTLIPKGAVLHVPPLYQKRVDGTRNGNLIAWPEFYRKNRNWIREVPITIQQASGENPLTAEFLQRSKSSGQILVTVCRGGPISVKLRVEDRKSVA